MPIENLVEEINISIKEMPNRKTSKFDIDILIDNKFEQQNVNKDI